MNKKSFLVELVFKKPCKTCLIQACCTKQCTKLDDWYTKFNTLIEINDITLILLAVCALFFLGVLNMIKVLKDENAISYADKIENYLDHNINR